ncbi:MAG TPA: type 4a pilus biogenesis protein PilO [Chitinispirillaceae bacterium]|nr:type 4a pilus biogenesis protein PilO [Chitinispirillaceae bacterium]
MRKINLKNPRYRIPILIVLIGIAGAFLWYQQFYIPTREIIVRTRQQHKNKEDTLRTILALKPQLEGLKLEFLQVQTRLDSLKNIFPDQKEIPKLINEITGVARATGIVTTKFNPLTDIEREYYVENRYNISVTGTYHGLAEFFAFLANFKVIVNLTSMNIAASNDQAAFSEYNGEEPVSTIVSMFEMTTFSSKK